MITKIHEAQFTKRPLTRKERLARTGAGIGIVALAGGAALLIVRNASQPNTLTVAETSASNEALADRTVGVLNGVIVLTGNDVKLRFSPVDTKVDAADVNAGIKDNVKRTLKPGEVDVAQFPIFLNMGTNEQPDIWDEFNDPSDGQRVYVHESALISHQDPGHPYVTHYVYKRAKSQIPDVQFDAKGQLVNSDPTIPVEEIGYTQAMDYKSANDFLATSELIPQ